MRYQILFLAASAAAAAADAEQSRRRTDGLGTSGVEEVSAEPLTFEVADRPPHTDRERILAEAEIMGGDPFDEDHPYEVMEGMDILDGEGEWTEIDAEDEIDEMDQLEYVEYGDDDEYWGDEFDQEEDPDEVPADEELLDDEDSEGGDEVGDPHEAYEPIARKLRRVVPLKEIDEERMLVEKAKLRDDSVPIFEPFLNENEEFELEVEPEYTEEMAVLTPDARDLQNGCRSGQKRVKVEIVTDGSGSETSWEIRKGNNALISRGPPNGSRYADRKRYVGGMCLGQGSYKFIVNDRFKDGMCSKNNGKGLYRFYINGSKRFTSPANCSVKWGRRVHSFQIRTNNNNNNRPSGNNNNRPSGNNNNRPSGNNNNRPSGNNNNRPNQQPTNNNSSISRGGCSNVKVQFKIDKYGKETSVTLSGGGRTHLSSNKDVGAYQTKTMTKCVPPGTYTLRLVDQDGICCSKGQGWYKMSVNGMQVVAGGYFVGSKSHTVKIGTNWKASMSARDTEWLNAHNARRRKYNGGKGYVPLRWSRALASDARSYAQRLGCGALVHAKGVADGENLAKNSGSGTWGQQYAADKIMGRWVENELSWPYPKNAHYTQVVWRATQYVGCGESAINQGGGKMCRVQVCRYTRPGNCNVRNGNWRAEAWKDDTKCGNPCPNEGCFV